MVCGYWEHNLPFLKDHVLFITLLMVCMWSVFHGCERASVTACRLMIERLRNSMDHLSYQTAIPRPIGMDTLYNQTAWLMNWPYIVLLIDMEILFTLGIPKVCQQKLNTGKCGAFYRRYFFNPYTMTCEKFDYGGCKGNQNRFFTKFSCLDRCLPGKSNALFYTRILRLKGAF